MKSILLVLLAIIVLASFTSCATIMSDSETEVTIASEPEGADIYIDGYRIGKTPYKGYLDHEDHTVEIRKDGYESTIVRINKSLKMGWQIADIFLTGFVGNLIDLCTDNGWKIEPNNINVTLIEVEK